MRQAAFPLRIFLSLASVILLTACGDVAYKQGAGPDQLTATKQKCNSQAKLSYDECMKAEGWVVYKRDDDNPLMVVTPVADNREAGGTPYVAAAAVAVPKKDATGKPIPPNPMDKLNVSSWWKMGGNADGLKTDTDACVATLGEAHRYVDGSNLYTRGLVLCLKDKGWSGLQGY
jgi:hypothetical protein